MNFVLSEESLCTVSLSLVGAVVTDFRNIRKYGVIVRQCLPCEKQAFHYVDLFLFFFLLFTAK